MIFEVKVTQILSILAISLSFSPTVLSAFFKDVEEFNNDLSTSHIYTYKFVPYPFYFPRWNLIIFDSTFDAPVALEPTAPVAAAAHVANAAPVAYAAPVAAATTALAPANNEEQFYNGLDNFGAQLYSKLSEMNSENIFFSQLSIEVCLAMVRMGAEGTTADEMDHGLALPSQNRKQLANNFHSVLEPYQNSSVLTIANKIYVQQGYEIKEEFNNLMTEQFFSSVDTINFANSQVAAQTINSWVENKTHNLIKELIKPDNLDQTTRLVLVNALSIKANWVKEFDTQATYETDFHLNEKNNFKVNMMSTTDSFNYGEIPELDATVLEMLYQDSDLSMLIILPNSNTTLYNVEKKLQGNLLAELTKGMQNERVEVHLPKFRVEFEAELENPLKNMGMKRMFADNAEFGQMLKDGQSLSVSSVVHKAVIKVDENGTEAAAATGALMSFRMGSIYNGPPKKFIVNRPFHFIIRNEKNVQIFKGSMQSKFLSN